MKIHNHNGRWISWKRRAIFFLSKMKIFESFQILLVLFLFVDLFDHGISANLYLCDWKPFGMLPAVLLVKQARLFVYYFHKELVHRRDPARKLFEYPKSLHTLFRAGTPRFQSTSQIIASHQCVVLFGGGQTCFRPHGIKTMENMLCFLTRNLKGIAIFTLNPPLASSKKCH